MSISNFAGLDGSHTPQFMLFTNASSRSIVLAISGTNSSKDAMVDLTAEEVKFLDGYAHKGMAESSYRILKEAGQILKKSIEAYPDYNLVITGKQNESYFQSVLTTNQLQGSLLFLSQKSYKVNKR